MDLPAALARWRALVGDDHVWTDDTRTGAAATATFPTTARVLAIVRPADTSQVAACARVAHELAVPLHPVSRGASWGLGSRAPSRDAVLLDLARLDRIVDFDERLAYVTVEPGVTFRQLAAYLRACRARVFASVIGGPADASVVANALERGDGAGPLGDRFAHACGLEVVLPTGELVHTGYARISGAHVAPLGRWGVGPALDGLFSQSRWGVVTRMTIHLAPYPRHFELAQVALDDDGRLPALIDALRGLRLRGIATAPVPVWNDVKAISVLARYPWDEAAGTTPLPPAVRAALRARLGVARWTATVALYGQSVAHAAALRELVVDALAPLARVEVAAGPADPLDAPDDACGPALGVPHDRGLAAAYWRKRGPLPARLDPDADRCGFLWLGHALPFDGGHARAASDACEAELAAGGFEPSVALLGVTERVLQLVAAIAYDRDVPGEDARALACHDRLAARLAAFGYPPFRLGLASHPPDGDAATARLLAALHAALDPRRILG